MMAASEELIGRDAELALVGAFLAGCDRLPAALLVRGEPGIGKTSVWREGVRVAIVGKPNVGKSSIMNLLLGTDRAIVTAIPGTTRDVIEDLIQVGPYPMVLQDTAGIRESFDEVEKIGIERSRRSLDEADIVLAVFDSSRTQRREFVRKSASLAGFPEPDGLTSVPRWLAIGFLVLRSQVSCRGELAFRHATLPTVMRHARDCRTPRRGSVAH